MTAAGELVPVDVPRAEVLDESNLRAHRAGYCTRDGGPLPRRVQAVCGWGRARPLNVWPRDAAGELMDV